jgi:phosphopantetheine adenylyltransferase
VLLVTSAKNVYLSSTFVRQTATLGRMIVPGAVPKPVEDALRERFAAHMGSNER